MTQLQERIAEQHADVERMRAALKSALVSGKVRVSDVAALACDERGEPVVVYSEAGGHNVVWQDGLVESAKRAGLYDRIGVLPRAAHYRVWIKASTWALSQRS